MNIALFGKTISSENIVYVESIVNKLKDSGVRLLVYEPFYQAIRDFVSLENDIALFKHHRELRGQADVMFSVGGDGTILDAMTLIRDSDIPIMGINIGRLGFLSSISKDEILPAINHVLSGNYYLDPRTLIKLQSPENLFGELNYAMNDITINRKESISLIEIHVYINDKFLNTYWADGLIVATPTGSTAYSLSSGGPIVTPGSENFLITPIAPHNLTVRPVVIPDKCKIRIIVEGRDKQFLVSLDSRSAIIGPSFEMVLEKAEFKVNLIQMKDKDFFSTIRDKLKWGLDIRN